MTCRQRGQNAVPDLLDRLKTALANRYSIEEELGSGGMATVYLAEDLKHDRKVAVKVLRPELAAVLGAERFVQEIKTTANLQHPHILPLFDSGEADSFLYYVMPFIDGENARYVVSGRRDPGKATWYAPHRRTLKRLHLTSDIRNDREMIERVRMEIWGEHS